MDYRLAVEFVIYRLLENEAARAGENRGTERWFVRGRDRMQEVCSVTMKVHLKEREAGAVIAIAAAAAFCRNRSLGM